MRKLLKQMQTQKILIPIKIQVKFLYILAVKWEDCMTNLYSGDAKEELYGDYLNCLKDKCASCKNLSDDEDCGGLSSVLLVFSLISTIFMLV